MSDLNEKVKSTTRQVGRWARRTGNLVGQWWEDVNALQTRRGKIRELARERRQVLINMGNKVYALHRKGKVQNRDLLADCGRIDRIGEDIARLEREIEELKRQAAEEPGAVEVSDEAPVVGEEDIEASAVEIEVEVEAGAEDTPEVEKEAAEPFAQAEAPAEDPAKADEGDDSPAARDQ